MKRIILIVALICITISCSAFMVKRKKDPGYLYARKYGAKANIELHVVDDDGKPVPDANVEVFMGMNLRNKGRWITGTTNTNGVFLVKGKTTGDEVEYYIKKDGYYRTFKKFTFAEMGKESNVVNGKWQPYGERETIVLREKRNPINIPTELLWNFKYTNQINLWIGYDIEKNDFVEPNGTGKVADFEVYFDWNGDWLPNYKGMSVKIRFTEPYGGYYTSKSNNLSELRHPYYANPDLICLTSAYFFEKKLDNEAFEQKKFDTNKCWIVRSRCKISPEGKLLESNYSVLYNIVFTCTKEGTVGFCLTKTFNPTPNDTNLEPEKVPTHSF